ncbi:MAG: four helix bundle protein [Chloroflexia bacterium]|nr:four helix bundle protein [Chloroflexia bacterium]
MERQRYRDLIAWQKAIVLVGEVYRVTKGWPREEVFGLTNQARCSAVSVPANIAEGQGRTGAKEFLHHLSIANGSLCETETHLLIGQQLGYIEDPTLTPLLEQSTEVGRLIHGLMRSLR